MLIPTRKGYFVKAENGENLRVTLCETKGRTEQLMAHDLLRFDPFQNGPAIEQRTKLDLEWD